LAAGPETIAETRGILATARDVCHDLGIKWVPNQVAFSEVTMIGDPTRRHSQPWYRDVPSDHPVMQGDVLVVAPSMKGRVSPAEWKPIVAASMIYYARLNTRKILGIIAMVAPFARAIGAGILAVVFSSDINLDFGQFGLLLTLAWLGLTLSPFPFVLWFERRLWLTADRQAADYAGQQFMIQVLERIESFKIAELEGGRTSSLPSVAQRIVSLKKYQGTTIGLD